MTAKDAATGADAATGTAEPVPAGDEGTDGPARPAPSAARRRRRVRVIEVIDDEDLDEVLEALDAEDASETPPADADADAETDVGAATPAAEPEPAKAPAPASDVSSGEVRGRPAVFGLGVPQAVVVVVLVALLASLAIWKWRSTSVLAAGRNERAAVSKVAAAYGDLAFDYNASNYRAQAAKAEELMGGDLLESYKSSTLPSLATTFKTNPEVAVSSKANEVFVGSVDSRFATAVVSVDVRFTTKSGTVSSPASLIRLGMAKLDGRWRITKQYASGVNDQNQDQQNAGRLPAVPGSGVPGTPKPGDGGGPGN